jgi:integrase
MRPSEQIALTIQDLDVKHGTLWVSKSKVYGVERDSTKTHQDRLIQLCPRALAVAKRQLALYSRLREIRLISQTPRLGGMMISEVSDGKAKFYEGVQGRGRSVGA